jgi:16S rRNA (guanine966-N2)-methyltransferase
MISIISGTAKGRKLKTLEGDFTRPTTSKVRAALFNTLQAWVVDASWLDLYAGSGAVGLEASSRGAKRVVMVEMASLALGVMRENVALTQLAPVEVLALETSVAIRRLAGQTFDVIFMDPPYADDPAEIMDAIAAAGLLLPHGRLVIEHLAKRSMPETVGPFSLLKTRTYSLSALSYYVSGRE